MDKSNLERVIVGNVVLHGSVIRRYLKKSVYLLKYNPDTETISLCANHGGGGEALMEIRNASHESAVKLAKELGLEDRGGSTECCWSKWNPILTLYHDGSEEAESFRIEMLKLGLPFTLFKKAEEWGVSFGQGSHTPPMWKADVVLDLIRDEAKRCQKELNSQP